MPNVHKDSSCVCYRRGAELVLCRVDQLQAVRLVMAPGRAPAADDPMLSPYGLNADDILRCHALLLQAMSSPTVAKGLRGLRARGPTPAKVERAARALDTAAPMLRKRTAASQQFELVLGFIGGNRLERQLRHLRQLRLLRY